MDFRSKAILLLFFNTAGMPKTGSAVITLELERKRFAEGIPEELYQELAEQPKKYYHVETSGKKTDPSFDF